MKLALRLLTGFISLSLLLASPAGHAQQSASPTADVLLLSNGQELNGRVLTIGPTELTYQPVPAAGAALLPDTVHLPAASVFLVRYANGTHEVVAQLYPAAPTASPDPAPVSLRHLSAPQRLALGQRDAQVNYRYSGPFWGSFVAGVYLGPLLGLASTRGIANAPVKPVNLHAPYPELLTEPNYRVGYQQQANQLKHRRAWGGYWVATSLYALLLGAVLSN